MGVVNPFLEVEMSIDAERIAESIKPSGSRVAVRNRLIKKALAAEFGYENVSVRGRRGTAYGWVEIKVRAKKPHDGECDWYCQICRDEIYRIRKKVWEILRKHGLDRELHTYYDDMGEKHEECIIDVELI